MRSEYETLARDIERIAALFGIAFTEPRRRDLVLLARTFETIDRHVDDTTGPRGSRAPLRGHLAALGDEQNVPHSALPSELTERVSWVRALLGPRGCVAPFTSSLGRFLEISETLRTTQSVAVYLSASSARPGAPPK